MKISLTIVGVLVISITLVLVDVKIGHLMAEWANNPEVLQLIKTGFVLFNIMMIVILFMFIALTIRNTRLELGKDDSRAADRSVELMISELKTSEKRDLSAAIDKARAKLDEDNELDQQLREKLGRYKRWTF